MLYLTRILVLLVISAGIDGARRPSSAFSADVPKHLKTKNNTGKDVLFGDRGLKVEESTTTEVGVQEQYVDIGAAGFADVELKLDMRAFTRHLREIPVMVKTLSKMEVKMEEFFAFTVQVQAFENQMNSFITIFKEGSGYRDSKIDALTRKVDELQIRVTEVDKNINRLINWLGGSNSGDGFPRDPHQMDADIQKILSNIIKLSEGFSKNIPQMNTNIGAMTVSIQEDFEELLQKLSVLEQNTKPGSMCPEMKGRAQIDARIFNSLDIIEQKVTVSTQQFTTFLPNVVQSRDELLVYIKGLAQSAKEIWHEIEIMRQSLAKSQEALKKYFEDSRESLVQVKQTVTETTAIVQRNAAAAISASRALRAKCDKNQAKIPDLDDKHL